VIGSNPPEKIQELNSEHIIVKGFVEDEELKTFYKKTKLVVAPLRYGAGVKGKIIEAMSHGIPLVTTKCGTEGLPHIGDVITAKDTEDEIANEIIHLYRNKNGNCNGKMLKQMSERYVRYVKTHFSKENAKHSVMEALNLGHGKVVLSSHYPVSLPSVEARWNSGNGTGSFEA